MIVASPNFLLFAAAIAVVLNLGSATSWRQRVLLIANVLFLSSFSHDITTFVPFAGFLALGYIAQRITRDGSMPRLFCALLLVTIGAFFWLKRYTFIPSAAFLQFPYLLVGLSYVFFRVLHLIIDSHQGAIEEKVGLLSYLNYTLNFTSLTSGPIQRYQDYRRAEVELPPLTIVVAGRAFERIVVGYFKVAIVSMVLSAWQHQAIDTLGSDHVFLDRVWAGVAVVGIYPLYLFFNFSGYTDVVIGTARFLRIELPENFDRPFSSGNFIQFWSRWHITLSNWLKTYVYNPLMMLMMARITAPRVAPYLAVFAFFVTFFLVGLWHGQTSEFLFFGFLQGGGVAANKLYQELMAGKMGRTR
jgi:alginate O-acetyltransferase complex protein AlgI